MNNFRIILRIGSTLSRSYLTITGLRLSKYSPIFTEPEANNCFSIIGLITVFDAILTSRQIRLEITVFVRKSDVKTLLLKNSSIGNFWH